MKRHGTLTYIIHDHHKIPHRTRLADIVCPFHMFVRVVGKGYLSGSGSPALCKEFYPKAGDDDYKAIDKGRTEPPANFAKVVPLLERFLR